jgi:hypothetical protein
VNYHPILFGTPYVLVFVICWFLLKLVDELAGLRPMPGPPYMIVRLVIILVGLLLCIL